MSIELLWIIPIVATALLVLVVALNLQQKTEVTPATKDIRDLKREVDEYNIGISSDKSDKSTTSEKSENRLVEIENTIQLVSTALSNQQKIIENFQGKDITLENELNDLKQRLQELQNEYDITISENYSLRARLKKLETDDKHKREGEPVTLSQSDLLQDTDTIERNKVLNIKIFNDTPKVDSSKPSDLDDTSEINLSELR